MSTFVCACRAGFENDCSEELGARLAASGARVKSIVAGAATGFVLIEITQPTDRRRLLTNLTALWPVFSRQLWLSDIYLADMPSKDRVSAIVDSAAGMGTVFCDAWVETADAESTRPLLPLCRTLPVPLREGLRKRGLLSVDPRLPRLHAFFTGSTSAYIGFSLATQSAKWPMGIPRLHMPRAAPSRSVLKLDEALLTFLSGEKRQQLLRPGMLAIDLGAAPGGWTWLLASMGLRVIAVDNGRIAPAVMQLETVEHRRMDGFKFHPPRGVDWLVCDIIEQPQRVADRLGVWFAKRWCKRAIFNLKLPMKKRYAALLQAQATFEKALSGRRYELQFRQLYHDREEVTGFYQDLQIG